MGWITELIVSLQITMLFVNVWVFPLVAIVWLYLLPITLLVSLTEIVNVM